MRVHWCILLRSFLFGFLSALIITGILLWTERAQSMAAPFSLERSGGGPLLPRQERLWVTLTSQAPVVALTVGKEHVLLGANFGSPYILLSSALPPTLNAAGTGVSSISEDNSQDTPVAFQDTVADGAESRTLDIHSGVVMQIGSCSAIRGSEVIQFPSGFSARLPVWISPCAASVRDATSYLDHSSRNISANNTRDNEEQQEEDGLLDPVNREIASRFSSHAHISGANDPLVSGSLGFGAGSPLWTLWPEGFALFRDEIRLGNSGSDYLLRDPTSNRDDLVRVPPDLNLLVEPRANLSHVEMGRTKRRQIATARDSNGLGESPRDDVRILLDRFESIARDSAQERVRRLHIPFNTHASLLSEEEAGAKLPDSVDSVLGREVARNHLVSGPFGAAVSVQNARNFATNSVFSSLLSLAIIFCIGSWMLMVPRYAMTHRDPLASLFVDLLETYVFVVSALAWIAFIALLGVRAHLSWRLEIDYTWFFLVLTGLQFASLAIGITFYLRRRSISSDLVSESFWFVTVALRTVWLASAFEELALFRFVWACTIATFTCTYEVTVFLMMTGKRWKHRALIFVVFLCDAVNLCFALRVAFQAMDRVPIFWATTYMLVSVGIMALLLYRAATQRAEK